MRIDVRATADGYPMVSFDQTLGEERNRDRTKAPDVVTCQNRVTLWACERTQWLYLSFKRTRKSWRYRGRMDKSGEAAKCKLADLVSFSIELYSEQYLDHADRKLLAENRLRFVDSWVMMAHMKDGATLSMFSCMAAKEYMIALHQVLTAFFIKTHEPGRFPPLPDEPRYAIAPEGLWFWQKNVWARNQVMGLQQKVLEYEGIKDTTWQWLGRSAELHCEVDSSTAFCRSVTWCEPWVEKLWVGKRTRLAVRRLDFWSFDTPVFGYTSIGRKKDWPLAQVAYSWPAMIRGFDILPASKLRLPASYRGSDGWELSTSRSALVVVGRYGYVRPLGLTCLKADALEPVLAKVRENFGEMVAGRAVRPASGSPFPVIGRKGLVPQAL